jgi:hypothetical protein
MLTRRTTGARAGGAGERGVDGVEQRARGGGGTGMSGAEPVTDAQTFLFISWVMYRALANDAMSSFSLCVHY